MNTARLLVFCLSVVLLTAALPVAAQNVYSTYRNARFGTVVQYPSDLLVPQRESDNGDGRRFVSRDGAVELSIYSFHNASIRTVNGEMKRAIAQWQHDGGRLTYWKWQGNWYALSGFIGSDIFYEKTLLKNGVFHTLIWQYPRSMRNQLDAPVTRSVRSFNVTGGLDRPVSRPIPRPTAVRPTPRPVPRPTPRVSITVVPASAARPAPATPAATPRKGGY